jgi:signal transduction histidine kinase
VIISELSRTVAFRLTLFYSIFFTACVIMLLGLIYWQTATEMTRRVDQVVLLEKNDFASVSTARLTDEIAKRIQRDQRHIYFYGLFAPDGQRVAGNVPQLPQGLPRDGSIYQLGQFSTSGQTQPMPARVLVVPLDTGNFLLLGHDVRQLVEFGEIMQRAFFWGGSLTILLGLVFGLGLSFRPLRRIEQIQQVCEDIKLGNFNQRLPVTRHRDELDMLAAIVNRMLDEIERLMLEVKNVGDNVAHDLRTPLTRMRAVLYRTQQGLLDMPDQFLMVEQAIAQVDSLLQRFRALLRISEIENNRRLSHFKMLQPQQILEQAVNFFAPLAEDKGVRLTCATEKTGDVYADGELLFEAVANLLDNALKFTPSGGWVEVRLLHTAEGSRIDITDSGTGILESDRTAALNRFYRGGGNKSIPGYGLGLSIVMAIIRLHKFGFALSNANPGARATIFFQSPHL